MRPHRPPALPVEAELEEFVAARDSSGEAVLAGGVGERRRSIDDVGRVEYTSPSASIPPHSGSYGAWTVGCGLAAGGGCSLDRWRTVLGEECYCDDAKAA